MSFSERVYTLCRVIPEGRVTTYKILAEKLGVRAYRAVGNALNRNPHAPEVPCHRVVGSDGSLVGFAHGLGRKRALLKKEGIRFRGFRIIGIDKVLYRF